MGHPSTVIIGAGPAGLTAGYVLSKNGAPVTVLEAHPVYVGGISRTEVHKGFHFDIGGHRFFSKSKEVEDFWTEILGDDMLLRPRSSRIFYNGKFFSYPLKAFEAFLKLGPVEAANCGLSYAKARLSPVPSPTNLEDWVSNQFGRRLYEIFFKTYTEKVWGMDCREISADWAAQRIKGLSLTTAILNAVLPKKTPKSNSDVIKTLIDTFRYPRKGPGQMWEECARKIQRNGGEVRMGTQVVGAEWKAAKGKWEVRCRQVDGAEYTLEADHLISSAPLRELVHNLQPAVGEETRQAASSLKYRDFLSVVVMKKGAELFADNWIYIHDPGVKVGRIQNFKAWSPEMVPSPEWGCYGLEYFCFEGDGLWSAKDEDLVSLAKKELEQIGLCKQEEILDGHVVRQPKAYPVYDEHYTRHVDTIRHELAERFPTLHVVGRNGMHKYNNQDHSMMTAMLAAENILAGKPVYDVWRVNEDADYHEAGAAGSQSVSGLRQTPRKVGT